MALTLVFLSLVASAFSASNVVDLTVANWDEYVNGDKSVFVEFFAPWCGHCKALAPEFEIVGDAFSKEDRVVIGKVDATIEKELGTRFGVTGYPTLKFFKKDKATEPEAYSGGRTADDIVSFINRESGARGFVKKAPSTVVTLDNSNFDSVVNGDSDVLVEFYAPWCGHCKKLTPIYEQVGATFKNDKNCVVAKVDADDQKELGGRFGISGFPTIKFFPKGDTSAVDYNGGRSEEDFIKYLNEKCGLKRISGGGLSHDAGRIDSLDILAAKFMSAAAEREAVATEAAEATADLDKMGQYYHKVMMKVMEKGDEFIATESTRIGKLLESKLSEKQRDSLSTRSNILGAFASSADPHTEL